MFSCFTNVVDQASLELDWRPFGDLFQFTSGRCTFKQFSSLNGCFTDDQVAFNVYLA